MNKPFRFFTVSMFAFLVAMPAYAATITLSPTTISVVKGQNVSIVISADPAGSKLYTVKSSISFPASLLEMTSFTQSAGWVPLSMAGYDSVDNTNGAVVKTAGYPGGFSNATSFGTFVFRAKESGTATISVANTSFAYDAQSKNTISGVQGLSVVTVTAPVVASVPIKAAPKTLAVAAAPKKITPTPASAPIEGETPVVQEEPVVVQPVVSPSQLAAVGGAVTLNTNNIGIGIIVAVILALVGYAISALIQRARRKNLGKPR